MLDIGIETVNLTKTYGERCVVDEINLNINKGQLFGFLGPNGAGKSTTIKMLSTILPSTNGTAKILGYDLNKERKKIRQVIGVCPQELVLYELLSARENIELIAKMYGIPRSVYKERIDDYLGKMNLLDRADDLVRKFSGGMKRRVNVLMAVIHDPEVVFFDEPSAGLDPQSRRVVWDFIKDFEKQNKTIILTTHNMEEADDLSEELAIIDHGKIIASGTPQNLKGKAGNGDIIEFRLNSDDFHLKDEIVSTLNEIEDVLWAKSLGKERIAFCSLDGLKKISTYYGALQLKYNIKMTDLVIRQNSLEDVFLDLTGRDLRN
ncbi:ABC transporter ATP-binding protein [Candidatus Lokiarchaeum ossiferum]|uniref:ABC transporter ATP-binding protein n=1 Tax=Candidatus Lokiarchaeum ossiferum TaxID=2951803 RepID=UPI00352DFAD7